MLENILLIIAGFFLLLKGADILVDGSSSIAKKFHISSLVIGLTVVAIGTSMPELMICVKSAVMNEANVAIGSVIGSNIFNILVVLGICSVLKEVVFRKETKIIEIPLCLLMTFTVFVIANNGGTEKFITKPEGIILLVLFICFFGYTIFIGKYGDILESKIELISEDDDISIFKNLIFVILGITALKFGGDFVVENIVELIKNFNLDEKTMSLTVVAIGTSLPELVTSINAILKKEEEIAIGNILGSNIFNFLLILGVASIINPIKYFADFNLDILFLFVITAFLMVISYLEKKNVIGRKFGFFLIIVYIAYLVSIFKN